MDRWRVCSLVWSLPQGNLSKECVDWGEVDISEFFYVWPVSCVCFSSQMKSFTVIVFSVWSRTAVLLWRECTVELSSHQLNWLQFCLTCGCPKILDLPNSSYVCLIGLFAHTVSQQPTMDLQGILKTLPIELVNLNSEHHICIYVGPVFI